MNLKYRLLTRSLMFMLSKENTTQSLFLTCRRIVDDEFRIGDGLPSPHKQRRLESRSEWVCSCAYQWRMVAGELCGELGHADLDDLHFTLTISPKLTSFGHISPFVFVANFIFAWTGVRCDLWERLSGTTTTTTEETSYWQLDVFLLQRDERRE